MAGGAAPRWRGALLAAAPVALAVALRVHALDWGRPEFFEEAVPLHRAWAMWAWDPAKHFDGNPHYFRYPTLVLYLNLLVQALTYAWLRLSGAIAGATDFQVLFEVRRALFFLPARGLSVLFAAGSVWMTLRLGRRLGGALLGVTAALLLAVNPLHVDWSQRVSVDGPLAFFAAWALLRCLRVAEDASVRNGVLAGAAIGLAASAKYTGAMLAVPLLVAVLLAPGSRRDRAKAMLVAGAAAVAAFALTSPWVLANPSAAWRDISSEREHMELGHFGSTGGAAWAAYARDLARSVLGPFAAAAALAGMALTAGVRRDRSAIVLASFVVAYLAVVGSWSMTADRYLLPVIPPLLAFAAVIPAEAFRRVRPRGLAAGTLAAVVLALATPAALGLGEVYARAGRDSRLQAMDFVEKHFPTGSLVVTEAYGPTIRSNEELIHLRPEILAGVRRAWADRPVYAVVTLPMSQVYPETSAPFYDLRLYRDADAIIVTDDISKRYRAEPERFPRQVAFYDSLDARFRKAADFPGRPGPRIRIYVDGLDRPPFGTREKVLGPVPEEGDGGGLKPGFWFSFGFAYETSGHPSEALVAYAFGLKSPVFSAGTFSRLVQGSVRSLAVLGRGAEAEELLDAAEPAAPWPEDRAVIHAFRAKLPLLIPRS